MTIFSMNAHTQARKVTRMSLLSLWRRCFLCGPFQRTIFLFLPKHYWVMSCHHEKILENGTPSRRHVTLCSVTTYGWSPVLCVQHPSGAHDQIFITVRQLLVCWHEAPPLVKGWICSLQLLLSLASAAMLGSESHMTHDHVCIAVSIWEYSHEQSKS
jgi:hypothetical protein